MKGNWDRWEVVDPYQNVGGVGIILFFFTFLVFCSLLSCVFFKWVELLCLFVYLLFVFFASGLFNPFTNTGHWWPKHIDRF